MLTGAKRVKDAYVWFYKWFQQGEVNEGTNLKCYDKHLHLATFSDGAGASMSLPGIQSCQLFNKH